jgi:cardiolipin synthase
MYYLSIVSARKKIFISNPYFIPDDSAVEILIEAKKRGVDVKIMVAGIYNDMRVSRYSSIHLYGKLLKAGIEIYEYNRTMLHQKAMVVDGVLSIVGSANFDNRSLELNDELNVAVFNRELANRVLEDFDADLQQSKKLDLDSWRTRSPIERGREWVWSYFGEVF